jgi:hypothetical protein
VVVDGSGRRHRTQDLCRKPGGQDFVIMAENGSSRAQVFVLVSELRGHLVASSVPGEETEPRDRRNDLRFPRSEPPFLG